MIPAARRCTIWDVNEEQAVTAGAVAAGTGGGSGLGVLIVWLAGYFHVQMSAEVGAVIGIMSAGAGASIAAYGIRGCMIRIWAGRAAVAAARRR